MKRYQSGETVQRMADRTRHLDGLIRRIMSQGPDSGPPPPCPAAERRRATSRPPPPRGRAFYECGLTAEQRGLLLLADADVSFFFTGEAGTGKTFALRRTVAFLKEKHGAACVAVTSSTGVSACELGGTTLHRFAGIGLGRGSAAELVERARRSSSHRWKEARVLVLDEVSMISGRVFDLVEHVARAIRGDARPFGGLQVVLCGDFHQLKPVFEQGEQQLFAFQSAAWDRAVQQTRVLTSVFRQSDGALLRVLRDVRNGVLSDESRCALASRVRAPIGTGGPEPTELHTHRAPADARNRYRLDCLPGKACRFYAEDIGNVADVAALRSQCLATDTLYLKVGAQVILIKNVDCARGLCNGARGVVTGFSAPDGPVGGPPTVRFRCGEVRVEKESWTMERGGVAVARRTQVPLILGWAITIHKVRVIWIEDRGG
jgi:ATP-dependent DNA helicase PIF1